MRLSSLFAGILLLFFPLWPLFAQDPVPRHAPQSKPTPAPRFTKEWHAPADTVIWAHTLPLTFKGAGPNEIDSAEVLFPVLEQLKQLSLGLTNDTLRVVHIGDSHVRGHIFPRTTAQALRRTFGAVSYTDMGINGATSLTFTHAGRIADIAALRPDLLILSFGTNESHGRGYNSTVHYRQLDELVGLLRDSLTGVPMLLTTPPGSYESSRRRRRRRTYSVNPRTAQASGTIRRYAREHGMAVWDLYRLAGGKEYACRNWTDASLIRPDHVHYMPEGYRLQGELFYEALIKAYNRYVSHEY